MSEECAAAIHVTMLCVLYTVIGQASLLTVLSDYKPENYAVALHSTTSTCRLVVHDTQ